MYNPKSLKAEEFISDEEIRETLAYADANKENVALIDQILAKAKECKGLTHREASVLLACPIHEKIQKMYDLAAEIKKEFYGNRIVLFAPLYLSNYCVNGCVYCPYHKKNQHIARKKLTQEEIVKEVESGIKRTKGKYVCIVDRKKAIEHAIKMATKNDIVVLAGKGHETYQEVNGVKNPFDEKTIIKQIINKM